MSPTVVPATPADEAAAAADPLFGRLRREHPDVTVVLLPEQDPGPPAEPVPVEEARAVADDVRARVGDVERVLGVALAGHEVWWRVGDRGAHRFVVRASLGDLGDDGPTRGLRALLHAFHDRGGWRDRPVAGDRPGLEAIHGTVRLGAVAHEASIDLTVTSAVLHLERDTVHALRGES
ncbi:hypothetical protein BH11ACT8_BH11ACT8_09900 [soil metagenome]